MINRVKCFTKGSLDDISLKIISEALTYEESKLQKVSGC